MEPDGEGRGQEIRSKLLPGPEHRGMNAGMVSK